MTKTKGKTVAVLVTTKHKGVFFGYLPADADKSKPSLELQNARCAIRFRGTKGFLGLAHSGPNSSCLVGLPAPTLLLHDITSVSTVTPEAVKAWESAPWS